MKREEKKKECFSIREANQNYEVCFYVFKTKTTTMKRERGETFERNVWEKKSKSEHNHEARHEHLKFFFVCFENKTRNPEAQKPSPKLTIQKES